MRIVNAVMLGFFLTAFTLCDLGTQPQEPESPPPKEPAAKPAEQAKPAPPEAEKKPAKPRKVFTNEDLEGRGKIYSQRGSRLTRSVLDQVNDCDRFCFDQVWERVRARWAGGPWKPQLLEAIEKVGNDTAWQVILTDMVEVRVQHCDLQSDKAAELAKIPDRSTVTRTELKIEETYEQKFKESEKRLTAVHDRATSYAERYGADPLRSAFMSLQLARLVNAQCQVESYEESGYPYRR